MKKNTSKFNLISIILMILLGFLSVIQIRSLQSEFKYSEIGNVESNLEDIELINDNNENIKIQIEELEDKLSTINHQDNSYASTSEVMKYEIEDAMAISGYTDLVGPGVIVIINDAERDIEENENPNNLLVHDLDIQALVSDLRAAGAEAIAVNGERYIFGKSSIDCTGPSIKINDKIYAQPFIITAIGDKKFLESAINAPGNYGETLRSYGLFVEVNTTVSVKIPKYNGNITYDYIEKGE